jgi:phage shock protein C
MNRSFTPDRRNGKIMGVCAGLAERTGVDAVVLRIGMMLLTLFALGPVAVVAYLLVGWLANG